MGTIKQVISYSPPLNLHLFAHSALSFPPVCRPSQAEADGRRPRWSAPQTEGLYRATQTPHPRALPSSLCCGLADTAHTQRSGASAVTALFLSGPTAHRSPPDCSWRTKSLHYLLRFSALRR